MPDVSPTMARVGKYLMLDHLGEGAFGTVRLAVDETSAHEYAIKIMQKSHIKANELTLQVRREIAVMKALRHPNIVNLHEVLTSPNNLYMVMDLVTGGELFDAVADRGRIPELTARSYFQQLVDGVHYCHSRRVYHRDLKPENLLLSADKQTLKITDFGLSSIKAHNASSELLHTIMGSPHYIAPEIITSAASGYDGAKVDVWASGVILYGMLSGYLPFDQPDTRALYRAIVQDPVKYPPHFSYDVIKLLEAMLKKDPDKRPTMEHVKTFPWFKVNYQPADAAEGNVTSADKTERKKLRHKLRKHGDRAGKKKKDKDDDSHSRLDAFKHARRQREPSDLDTSEDTKFAAKSSVVVEVATNCLDDDPPRVSRKNSTTIEIDRHTKENIDPTKPHFTQTGSRDAKTAEPTRSFSDRSEATRSGKPYDGRIFSRPSNHTNPFARASDPSRLRSGEDAAKAAEPARSFTKLSNVARSFTMARFRHSSSNGHKLSREASSQGSFARKESASIADVISSSASRANSAVSRLASFSSPHSTFQTDVFKDVEEPTAVQIESSGNESDAQSVSEQTSRASETGSWSSSKGRSSRDAAGSVEKDALAREARRSVTGSSADAAKKSARDSGEGNPASFLDSVKVRSSSSDFEPASVSAFISPVSINSKASFKSIGRKRENRGTRKSRISLPSDFESPISRADVKTPRACVPNLDDDTCTTSIRGFDDGVTPVNSLVNSSIFKPMSGLLETLVQQTPMTEKESMSPSVFCPEVEGEDVEGTAEWGIDSVEVFADVEAPETRTVTSTEAKPKLRIEAKLKVAKAAAPALPAQPLNNLKRMDSSSLSIIEAAKPIFGPLSQEFELKLTPSMEAEAAGTAAVRKLQFSQTKT